MKLGPGLIWGPVILFGPGPLGTILGLAPLDLFGPDPFGTFWVQFIFPFVYTFEIIIILLEFKA